MTARHKHAHADEYSAPKSNAGTQGLGLWEQAPSAPGSRSSEDAADSMTVDTMQREEMRVLTYYAAQSEPRTRHECADVLYQYTGGIGPACARINALVTCGYLEEVGRDGRRATLRITSKGRAKFAAMERAA